ncbi:Hypothetical Protein SLY_0072 [Strawberry lethal yellows phytoplasma (CPA) str. NZSb11]|uniref:Uncharacterized protein n=1 Tax=Strawberry lethal yellows phytoplasma (CPA) str. NZSb11 TaxID=980422 RepID=R4RZV7_PHYAS|nr:Hypothetical Protein SLY_0072 [Strawberry lethal yellows phytoplasma (CPA) str. NZSb11]
MTKTNKRTLKKRQKNIKTRDILMLFIKSVSIDKNSLP